MADNRQRGQVGIAAELQQRTSPSTTGGASLVDNGVASMFQTKAAEFDQLGKKIGAWADHATQVEGSRDGALAGLDPEFRPTRQMTIRGEAFDLAGLQVMQAKLKQQIAADAEGIGDKAGHDPVKVGKSFDAIAKGYLDSAPEELKPTLTLWIDGHRQAAVRQAARVQRANFIAEQKAAAHTEFTIETKAAQQQAFSMGLDPEADAQLASRIAGIERVMRRKGVDGQPLYSPAERERNLEKMQEEIAQARTMGAFSRLTTLEEKQRFIEQFRADYASSAGQAKFFTRDQFHGTERELLGELRQAKALQMTELHAVQQDVRGAVKLAEKGFELPQRDLAALTSRVEATRDPRIMQEFADAQAIVSVQNYWRGLNAQQLGDELAAMREHMRVNGASPRGEKMLELGDGLLKNMHAELKSDPLGWAAKSGLLDRPDRGGGEGQKGIVPLDLRDAGSLAKSLGARIPQAETVAQHYGLMAPDYIRPDEANALSGAIAQGGQKAIDVIAAIQAGGRDKAAAIFKELHDKHGPATAQLGQLYLDQGRSKAVADAADGFALMRTPDFKSLLPDPKITQPLIDTATQGALANDGAKMTAVRTVANAIYEKRALQQRLTVFTPSVYEQAVKDAIGEHTRGGVTYGGIKSPDWWSSGGEAVIVPPFVQSGKLSDVVKMITPDDLERAGLPKPVGRYGKELGWSRVSNGSLIMLDDARYAVKLGTGSDGKDVVAMSSADRSKPFVIDLRALRPALSKRRPDLVLPE